MCVIIYIHIHILAGTILLNINVLMILVYYVLHSKMFTFCYFLIVLGTIKKTKSKGETWDRNVVLNIYIYIYDCNSGYATYIVSVLFVGKTNNI